MRPLFLVTVAVFGVVQMAHAETLFLNSAQTQVSDTQPVAVHHPTDHYVGSTHDVVNTQSGCPNGGCRNGSLDQYPGGCCEPNGDCCAALWANYCQEKKPCWTPGSPRRHSMAGGLAIPCLPKLHCSSLFYKFGHGASKCDNGLNCDVAQCDVAQCDTGPAEGQCGVGDLDPPEPSTEDFDAAGQAPQPEPPPSEIDAASTRKSSLPFGLKLPAPMKSNPFKTFPTAGRRLPFSR